MKKAISKSILFLGLLSLILISPMSSFAETDSTANPLPTNAPGIELNANDFDNETIITSYVEDGDLYVVTMSNPSIPPAGGKCPSRTRSVTATVTRKTLQQWRDANEFEYSIRTFLASFLAGKFHAAFGDFFSILGLSSPALASQCQNILDNTTQVNLNITCTFTCSQKVQSSSWFHTWKLSGASVR